MEGRILHVDDLKPHFRRAEFLQYETSIPYLPCPDMAESQARSGIGKKGIQNISPRANVMNKVFNSRPKITVSKLNLPQSALILNNIIKIEGMVKITNLILSWLQKDWPEALMSWLNFPWDNLTMNISP